METEMKKNILIPLMIAGVIVLIAGAGVGGFFYGKSYESNRANTIRDNFMRERGIQGFDPNTAPSQGQVFNQDGINVVGGGFGRGASGEIKSIDGNTLTLGVGENETKVTLADNTAIVKTVAGSTADLTAGLQIMVVGERDADGMITATQVTILSGSPLPSDATP
jgi:hypothetical protein